MSKVITRSSVPFVAVAAVVSCCVLATSEASPRDAEAEDAGFKPVVEAPLPDGFPTYTPVGEIEVKRYPAYRKAESSGAFAFWTLFNHISRSGIAMTAPVEMTYETQGPPVGKERSMAFLYGNQNLGSPGPEGNLKVIDVPAATVVSMGLRGARSETVLKRAEQELRDWLTQNKDAYEQSGPLRVMGYNSPFIARDRQFFEVQIPVRELGVAKSS